MVDKLKIMSYNVQWFTGINSQLDMQRKIFDRQDADVIGLQELTVDGRISGIGREALSGYRYQYLSGHKNYMGLVSRFPLQDVRCHEFKHQDPEDMARYGETRAYMTAWLEIGGKRVKLINTHLAYLTPAVKYQQAKEIYNSARQAESVIIMGDFNCFDDHERMYRRFIDNGFHMANCDTKITKTWTDRTDAKSLSDFSYPTDNVITSGNITIKKARFDKTKLRYPDGHMMDHIPIAARLYIH